MADKEQVDPSEYTPGKITITRQEYDELTQTKKFIDGKEIARIADSLEQIVKVMRTWVHGFK
ncbi:MAG: hypothetical protein COC11_04470 [Candidatus Neomarinimicrobiota bacterium]|nr:MAG: hypothetical protein COC11_04470 [Candidatus Neomarinimicrobiota bacterium]